MEVVTPRPKKYGKFLIGIPNIDERYKSQKKIRCDFNGYSVHVNNLEDMKMLQKMGCFGKANLSRSLPEYYNNETEIIRARQYDKRMEWTMKTPAKLRNFKKIIIVYDSDEEENYFSKLKPSYEIDKSGIKEAYFLSFEEAFFLAYCIEAVNVYKESKVVDFDALWALFSESDPYFVSNYLAYNYFRSKNWIVKPGLKFGGDFLLYKEGPSAFHASYVVVLDVYDQDHQRIDALTKRSLDNVSLLCLNRVCEAAGKELLICEVLLPEHVDYHDLSNVMIKEILLNRCTELFGNL